MRNLPAAIVVSSLIGVAHAATDGEYLFNAAGCLACHTSEDGPELAGGRAFETPYGTFYSPNISPDEQTGIGNWSKAQFIEALKHGTSPQGDPYFPVFPYPSYRLMTDEDAGAIYDYLMQREPQQRANREHDTAWWLGRWMMTPWQWWFEEEPPAAPDDAQLARGRYLVDALGHCGECHTSRNWAGVADRSYYLAGNPDGPDGEKVPNITPDRSNGIGKWDTDDLKWFLQSGELPDGDYTGGAMSEVIDNTTSKLTPEDRTAMAKYLKSLPALETP